MFEKAIGLYIYADTPVHTGSGIEINSSVDLPIQRERHTEFPIIPGSGVKGAIKQLAKDKNLDNIDLIFGSDNGDEGKSGISITDAKILAYPVRTMKGVFGWITCPLVLERFKREMMMAGLSTDIEIPSLKEEGVSCNELSSITYNGVVVEDLVLKIEDNHSIDLSKYLPNDEEYKYLQNKIKKDLIVVHDSVFADMTKMTTEIVARIKIDHNTGTVAEGALWYEEYLPSDTLLYSLMLFSPKEKMNSEDMATKVCKLNNKILHLGGDETIGKGFTRIKMVNGGQNES